MSHWRVSPSPSHWYPFKVPVIYFILWDWELLMFLCTKKCYNPTLSYPLAVCNFWKQKDKILWGGLFCLYEASWRVKWVSKQIDCKTLARCVRQRDVFIIWFYNSSFTYKITSHSIKSCFWARKEKVQWVY